MQKPPNVLSVSAPPAPRAVSMASHQLAEPVELELPGALTCPPGRAGGLVAAEPIEL